MSRDIKFRAWDIANERFRDLHHFEKYRDKDGFEAYESWRSYEGGRYYHAHITQYTGLKDKNGKEIYEGDVVQCTHEHRHRTWDKPGESKSLETSEPEINKPINTVVFNGGSFRIGYLCTDMSRLPEFMDRGENFYGTWSDRYTEFEVIGNIFENPELLQQ